MGVISAPPKGSTPIPEGIPPTPEDGIYVLEDQEIGDLWAFTYREPCPPLEVEEERWKLIKLAEEFWKEHLAEVTSRLDQAKDECKGKSTENYNILSLYSAYQVLLFGASLSSSHVTYHEHLHPLYVLCWIITGITIASIFKKLLSLWVSKGTVDRLEQQQKISNFLHSHSIL